MTRSPLVSCIVPVFNSEQFLGQALDSILAQTYAPLEVIAVDDGSTDGTRGVVAGFGPRVTYIYQENAGPAAARNRGVATARGEFVAFLDADDLWHREYLERQMVRFDARPELDICTAQIKNFCEAGVVDEDGCSPELMAPRPGTSQANVVRRNLFDRVGRFDETLAFQDWMEWYVRALDAGAVSEAIDEVLVHRRIHRGNRSRDRAGTGEEELLRIVKMSLDRRRHMDKSGEG